MNRLFLKLAAIAGMAAMMAACGGNDDPVPTPTAAVATKNVVQVAQADPQFSILVEAVVKAKLDTTLSGAGPFTVFAPTNDAFVAALAELKLTKDQLLSSPDLAKILTYHVLGSKVLKADIPFGKPVASVQGDTLTIDTTAAITDQYGRKSKITATDILAANGVIHVIDKVILPKNIAAVATKNIVEIAASVPEFSTLVTALQAAGLTTTLASPGPFTVFAPTNAAFAKIPPATLSALLADKPALIKVLTYHVVPGKVLKSDVVPLIGKPIATAAGPSATFVVGSDLKITDQKNGQSQITATDTFATNGVIHTIDTVIMPN